MTKLSIKKRRNPRYIVLIVAQYKMFPFSSLSLFRCILGTYIQRTDVCRSYPLAGVEKNRRVILLSGRLRMTDRRVPVVRLSTLERDLPKVSSGGDTAAKSGGEFSEQDSSSSRTCPRRGLSSRQSKRARARAFLIRAARA